MTNFDIALLVSALFGGFLLVSYAGARRPSNKNTNVITQYDGDDK